MPIRARARRAPRGELFTPISHVAALEHLGAERLGPAARQIAQLARHEADDRVGDVVLVGVLLEVGGVGVGGSECQREVADDLRRRRHLRRSAEDAVRRRVPVLDLLELVAEAEGDGLLAQVGQLAARDLVVVHPTGRAGQSGLERLVDAAHGLPVRLEVGHRLQGNARVALGVGERGDQCRGGRLAGRAGHRRAGDVDGVRAGAAGGEQGGQLAARGVVGVHVDGQVEALPKRVDELFGGAGAQQSRHVLDGEDVRPGVDDLLGQPQVVVEGVEVFCGVEQVAGVAEGHLGDAGAGGEHRVDGRPHLGRRR